MKRQWNVRQALGNSPSIGPIRQNWRLGRQGRGRLVTISCGLLCLALLLSDCGTTNPVGQTVSGSEEPAIEAFLANAPVTRNQKENVLPTVMQIPPSRIPLPEVDPLQVVGDITTAGSETMSGLTERLYRRFVADGYNGFIKLEELSTSDAFTAFCGGGTDMVAATRPILQTELDSCLQHGRTPLVFPIGTDALVVVVNRNNEFVQDVTQADLALMFKAKRWSDVNPAWPKQKIVRLLPPIASDDFLFFTDTLFDGNSRLLETAPNSTFLSDAGEIVQRLQDNPDAIGLINYTIYMGQNNTIRLVKIAGLEPEVATMQKNTYPLHRPLLLYSAPQVLQNKLQLSSFLTFYLTYANEEIQEEGKFLLTPVERDRSRLNLLVGTANEAFLDDLRETTAP